MTVRHNSAARGAIRILMSLLFIAIPAIALAAIVMESKDLGFRFEVPDTGRWSVDNKWSKPGPKGYVAWLFKDKESTLSIFAIASGSRRPGEDFESWTLRQLNKSLRAYGGAGGSCSRQLGSSSPTQLAGLIDAKLVDVSVTCGTLKAETAYVHARSRDDEVWVYIWFHPANRRPQVDRAGIPDMLAAIQMSR